MQHNCWGYCTWKKQWSNWVYDCASGYTDACVITDRPTPSEKIVTLSFTATIGTNTIIHARAEVGTNSPKQYYRLPTVRDNCSLKIWIAIEVGACFAIFVSFFSRYIRTRVRHCVIVSDQIDSNDSFKPNPSPHTFEKYMNMFPHFVCLKIPRASREGSTITISPTCIKRFICRMYICIVRITFLYPG